MWKWTIRFGAATLAGAGVLATRRDPDSTFWAAMGTALRGTDAETSYEFAKGIIFLVSKHFPTSTRFLPLIFC